MIYEKIAQKIENMIKEDIKLKNLIRTGNMYRSIQVASDGQGDYVISTIDYFVFVNARYNIIEDVFESKELEDYITKIYEEFILEE